MKVLCLSLYHTISFRRRASVANSFKISSVAGVRSCEDVIAEVPEKPVQCRLVQTDKDDLTHKEYPRWSHVSSTDQRTVKYNFELAFFAGRNWRKDFYNKEAYSDLCPVPILRLSCYIAFVSV